MRVLLTLHHQLDPNLGAPGATLALGAALAAEGCSVDYWGFERAFPGEAGEWGVGHSIRFPWKTAAFLKEHAAEYDVVDASTGDAWLWAARGRPGAGPDAVLATRSHGLEHVLDAQIRVEAKATGRRLSWKYPLYHGGWRLREVNRSLRLADACFLLNDADRDFVRDVLKVPAERLYVNPNGIADTFFDRPEFTAPLGPSPNVAAGEPLRLVFLGSWIPRKGIAALGDALSRLAAADVPFELTAFGTGAADEATVRAELDPAVRERVRVVPRYAHAELPGLLAGCHVLVFPSLSEGFSLALVEAMACGLAPVATAVGGAPAVLQDGVTGFLVPSGDGAALAVALRRLATLGPAGIDALRQRARETSAAYRWSAIARQTITVYEDALRQRGGAPAGASATPAPLAAAAREEAAVR